MPSTGYEWMSGTDMFLCMYVCILVSLNTGLYTARQALYHLSHSVSYMLF
jgi:hypothetical protein